MVMIIIHIAYFTCLVGNDAWHANDVIASIRYITQLVESHILRNQQYCGWLVRLWARLGLITGGMPRPRGQDHWSEKNIVLINQ